MPRQVTAGDVVRNEFRWGPRPSSSCTQCPHCTRFVSPKVTTCPQCGTYFEPIAKGHVQVMDVPKR